MTSAELAKPSRKQPNAEEFGAWLDTVRGHTDVIVSEHRPVPLWQHVMVGREIVDLFAGETTFDEIAPAGEPNPAATAETANVALERGFEVNPDLLAMARTESQMNSRARFGHGGRSQRRQQGQRGGDGRGSQGGQQSPVRKASRPQVIASLDRQDLLPAITFIFSRAGCDAAVAQCVAAGLWLTTEQEQAVIARRVDEAAQDIPSDDLDVLGFWSWRDGLLRGLAAHHAGMLPTYRSFW